MSHGQMRYSQVGGCLGEEQAGQRASRGSVYRGSRFRGGEG